MYIVCWRIPAYMYITLSLSRTIRYQATLRRANSFYYYIHNNSFGVECFINDVEHFGPCEYSVSYSYHYENYKQSYLGEKKGTIKGNTWEQKAKGLCEGNESP